MQPILYHLFYLGRNKVGHILDYALPVVASIAANAIVPGSGLYVGAATSGGLNYAHNHNIGSALGAAGGSVIGSNLGGSLGGNLGTVGSALGTGSSSDIAEALGGGSFGSAIGNAAGTSLGSVAGAAYGNQIGSQLGAQLTPPKAPGPPAPFQPSQAGAASLPSSLSGMSSLTPMQQASGLATQGVYGGGLAPQEQSYYGNLINRQLVDSGGNVSPLSSLSPIEQSYNSKLGFGNEGNSNNLLQALSQWNPTA